MKFRYTFENKDKTLIIEMTDTTMFIYERYLKMGYEITKREILINGHWLEII